MNEAFSCRGRAMFMVIVDVLTVLDMSVGRRELEPTAIA